MFTGLNTLSQGRDEDRERREQRRYDFLERFYLLTGEECGAAIRASEIEGELGVPLDESVSMVQDLKRLGYVAFEGPTRICITEKGIAYVQQGAWRRRSIRG
jgi:Mn-dependent DtxR family transcriptional regulator